MEKLGDYDTVTVVLTTASGKQAVITNSREAAYGYDQRVEALGSKGMAVSENRRPHHMQLSGKGFSNHAAPLLHFFIERYQEAFDAEIDAFVEAVEIASAAGRRIRGRAAGFGARRGGAEVGCRSPRREDFGGSLTCTNNSDFSSPANGGRLRTAQARR